MPDGFRIAAPVGAVFHVGPDWKIHFEGVKEKR